ncbi:unnamed protein product [Peronospora destructor]|uniref:C2 domain-containing protein n=1 Tax=Peronospora destructor TaxID=86335 RepID=A0AAV0V504_9STRA|nr:unnamed protein product [Peronospora destructor]
MASALVQRYKLVLQVYSAEELQHSSSQGAYCKLYVGSTTVIEGSHKAMSKKDSTDVSTSNEELNEVCRLEVRRTRTQQQELSAMAPSKTCWDEMFEVPIRPGMELARQIVSIRVKSQHLFFCPVIGACAVSLANLCPGERLKQWFPLQKGKKNAGRIRIMLRIAPEDNVLVARRKQPNKDVVAARAANHEAEKAIKRLVDKQLRQEAERRQKRLHRTSSGPPVELKRPAYEQDDNLSVIDNRHERGENVTWPLPPDVSSPTFLPPLGTSAALGDSCQQEKEDMISHLANKEHNVPVTSMLDYEQRLDRKLRQVRKETARLQKLMSQLKKYIPDLQMDSDSDDSLDSEEEMKMLLLRPVLSSESERHQDV